MDDYQCVCHIYAPCWFCTNHCQCEKCKLLFENSELNDEDLCEECQREKEAEELGLEE